MASPLVVISCLLIAGAAGDSAPHNSRESVEKLSGLGQATAPQLRGSEPRQLQQQMLNPDGTPMTPEQIKAQKDRRDRRNQISGLVQLAVSIIFACIYKSNVVDKYPALQGNAPKDSRAGQLQRQNEVTACLQNLCTSNCLLSWCCGAARAGHTFDKVGIGISYWMGFLLMMCCPFCTLTYTNACTDMNERLGGEQRNCIMAIICAWCCGPCVIMQDAASLDAATGATTGFCSVTGGQPFLQE